MAKAAAPSGLPPGWAWDYDGTRWFYQYLPNGHVQYHFPSEGDEFPSYIDAASPAPALEPEELLESQQQQRRVGSVVKRAPARGRRNGREGMTATARPVGIEWDGDVGEDSGSGDGEGAGSGGEGGTGKGKGGGNGEGKVFEPENFMFLGPGTYVDVSPLNEEEEEAAKRSVVGEEGEKKVERREAGKEKDAEKMGEKAEKRKEEEGLKPVTEEEKAAETQESTASNTVEGEAPVTEEASTAPAPVAASPDVSASPVAAASAVADSPVAGASPAVASPAVASPAAASSETSASPAAPSPMAPASAAASPAAVSSPMANASPAAPSPAANASPAVPSPMGVASPVTAAPVATPTTGAPESPPSTYQAHSQVRYVLPPADSPFDPVGVIAEMPTGDTPRSHIELNPIPVEIGDSTILAPIETAPPLGIAELPGQTSPKENKPAVTLPGTVKKEAESKSPEQSKQTALNTASPAEGASPQGSAASTASIPPALMQMKIKRKPAGGSAASSPGAGVPAGRSPMRPSPNHASSPAVPRYKPYVPGALHRADTAPVQVPTRKPEAPEKAEDEDTAQAPNPHLHDAPLALRPARQTWHLAQQGSGPTNGPAPLNLARQSESSATEGIGPDGEVAMGSSSDPEKRTTRPQQPMATVNAVTGEPVQKKPVPAGADVGKQSPASPAGDIGNASPSSPQSDPRHQSITNLLPANSQTQAPSPDTPESPAQPQPRRSSTMDSAGISPLRPRGESLSSNVPMSSPSPMEQPRKASVAPSIVSSLHSQPSGSQDQPSQTEVQVGAGREGRDAERAVDSSANDSYFPSSKDKNVDLTGNTAERTASEAAPEPSEPESEKDADVKSPTAVPPPVASHVLSSIEEHDAESAAVSVISVSRRNSMNSIQQSPPSRPATTSTQPPTAAPQGPAPGQAQRPPQGSPLAQTPTVMMPGPPGGAQAGPTSPGPPGQMPPTQGPGQMPPGQNVPGGPMVPPRPMPQANMPQQQWGARPNSVASPAQVQPEKGKDNKWTKWFRKGTKKTAGQQDAPAQQYKPLQSWGPAWQPGVPVQDPGMQGWPMQQQMQQPMPGQPMQGQQIQGQPMQRQMQQPMQGHPMQQPMQGQPMQRPPWQGQPPMQGQITPQNMPLSGNPTHQMPPGQGPMQQMPQRMSMQGPPGPHMTQQFRPNQPGQPGQPPQMGHRMSQPPMGQPPMGQPPLRMGPPQMGPPQMGPPQMGPPQMGPQTGPQMGPPQTPPKGPPQLSTP